MSRKTVHNFILPLVVVGAFIASGASVVSWKRAAAPPAAAAPETPWKLPERISFNAHVQPVLSENCYRCHGPDTATRKAELRLDRPEFAFANRKDGKPVIMKGDPEASALVRRIKSKDIAEVMPPPESHKSLKPFEIALLEKWVGDGAPYEEHWSFIKPKRPELPDVKRADWPRNGLDHFVLARLEAAGLAPNNEADRRTLIRRVTLDLTGLPPRPEEVEAFANDPDPQAYEKLVDRLLESPRWGEHRGRYWLDYARYADTHGLHFDNYRSIWPYRDWVIRAFNANMPFDRFTIEQLAGDMLPNPTQDQRIATGFNRCAISTNEGGLIEDEYAAIYAKDRVDTTAMVWMGLTVGCGTCHDHKFDPITQKEFYQFTAFFRNTTQPVMDGNIEDSPPVVRIPREEDRERLAALPGEIERARKAVEARVATVQPDFQKWQAALSPGDIKDVDVAGLIFRLVPGETPESLIDIASDGRTFTLVGAPVQEASPQGTAVRLPAGTSADLGAIGDLEADKPFSYGAWIKLPQNAGGALLARMDQQDNYKGWDLWVQGNQVGAHIISKWNNDALKAVGSRPVPAGQWTHVFITYDGSKKVKGLKIYYNGVEQEPAVEADSLIGSIRTKTPLAVGRRSHGQQCVDASLRDIRFYERLLKPEEVLFMAEQTRLTTALETPPERRTPEQLKLLRDYYLAFIDKEYVRLKKALADVTAEFKMREGRSIPTLVMEEKKDAAFAHVLIRGQYDRKGERVTPGVPRVLPPLGEGRPANRLGLAEWLVSPDHPFTARVTVNRFWSQVFGSGLVRTPGDFGTMGERPLNQDLLDWLAVEFREAGWDMKKFFRLMVTSATYRQSAALTPEKREKDPDNRLFSRGPRFRMDGEMLRDLALAASGLLSDRMGGPSVKPYQPAGLWEVVAMEESNTKSYKQDKGEALFRRSVYTFWKRAAPPPSMETFNAPTREECTVRRDRTNTPLQALVVLNDPTFIESARVLATRAIKEGGDRLDFIALRVLSRKLDAAEKEILGRSLKSFLARYEKDPAAAEALLKVGESPVDKSIPAPELAAWTLVATQFFNLDEALNK